MLSLVDLHDAAGQATGLNIDSDATTVRLVMVGLRDVPQLGVALGRLRRVGTTLAEAAAQSRAPGGLHELRYEVVRSTVMLERALADLDQQFGHDLPGLAGTMKADLRQTSRRVLELVNERLVTEIVTVGADELAQAIEAALAAGRPLRAAAVEAVQQRLTQRLATVERRALVLGMLLVVALSAGAYMLFAFLRVTSGGLEVIHRQVMRLADGDLSARPEPLGRDEVAAALSGLSQSLNKLSDLMASVRQGVSAMNHATQEIARGNGALSTRNEKSTATIAQIVERVNGYSRQLEQTAGLVAETAHAVDALRLDAMRSHRHMDKLRERVQALQVNGRRIGEIAALMDGIAFRTNVLALNASIQASKAGEAGKGFAVVAQEVRALAMRSADSARSIHEIVAGSGEGIAQAYELATVTDQSLGDTYAHVERIHGVMNQVVTLTQGGQKAMEALVGDVQQLDASTRDNHRLVEQLAAASDALRRQGERLARKVSSFRLR
jgi:methyl-accepting chemotaxis protein